jgi:hypothetical protein
MGPYAKVGQSKLLRRLAGVTPSTGTSFRSPSAQKEEHSQLNDHFFCVSGFVIN